MNEFKILRNWLSRKGNSPLRSAADASLCRLQLLVNNRVVTEYSGENVAGSTSLEIPAYFLGEWIAENWWPLLWEPRKSEDTGDDADFLARHSFLTAQHGFALPKVMIVPFGKNVQVSASARDVQFADIRFRHSAAVSLPRQEIESELKSFVSSVADRLRDSGFHETDLQRAWDLISATEEDEAVFCRCVGALGLSPYVENKQVEAILERVLPELGERLTMDLCLASVPESFDASARVAEMAKSLADAADTASLAPLTVIPVPADNYAVPAWRRGVQAAQRVRTKLGIKETDSSGADRLFEKLGIDHNRQILINDANEIENAHVVGAVLRNDLEMRVALLQQPAVKRRFAAARAVFTAWSSEQKAENRLLTLAVTRDQQASRAFAAELTAPLSYLRSHARAGTLSQNQVYELASNLEIGADVVQKQALNNGLRISSS